MESLNVPLSREATSIARGVRDTAKETAGKWSGHHRWGRHAGYIRRGGLLTAGAFVAVPTLAGYANSIYATAKDREDPWFKRLKMPSWTLPESMFSPIWTACYSSMGLASFLVWRHGGGFSGRAQLPLLLYGSQLALNLSWIPVCYRTKSLKKLSLISVGTLLLASATTASFHKVMPAASYILMPYIMWLIYETCLTLSMYHNNPDAQDN